jgi:hypothetical protein
MKNKKLMYNKKCSNKFLKAFTKALSFYPELKNIYIIIYETKLNGVQHTLRAYPPLVTLHWSKSNWVYPIVINKKNNINLSFYNLNFEEQVGLLSHELSHISTYVGYSIKDVIKFSTKYALNKIFVKKIEKETDLDVIKRGLGLYLLKSRIAYDNFRKYKKYEETEDTYLTTTEIISYLKKIP